MIDKWMSSQTLMLSVPHSVRVGYCVVRLLVLRERLSRIEPGEEAGKILLEQDAPWSTVNFVVS